MVKCWLPVVLAIIFIPLREQSQSVKIRRMNSNGDNPRAKRQVRRTFDVMRFDFSGKTTAASLSNDINRRLSTETSTDTSGRKVAHLT